MRVIPKYFDVLGHTIEVVMRDDLMEVDDCDGRFVAARNQIELQSDMVPSVEMATFWHECMHVIATHMGMKDLNEDEEKIDKLGQGVAQILKTKRSK